MGIVVGLAAMGLVTQLGADRAEQASPPIGRFADVDGTRLHYTDGGSGPAVVLVHGASTSLLDFESSLAGPLRQSHRVIAVDRPGHGYSERPPGDWPDPAEQARLIHDLLDDLGVDQPVLVGHSWSGSVVLAYLIAYPDATAGGVLLAGGTHPWEGGVAWYNDVAGVPLLGDIFVRTVTFPVGQLAMASAIEAVFEPNPVPADYAQANAISLTLRPATFAANAEDVSRLSDFLAVQSERYPEIRRPLLVFTGKDDDIVPAWNHADRLAKQIDRIERVDFDDTGHALHHVHAQRIADLIAAFVSRVGSAVD